MVALFGRQYTRAELLQYVGDITQVGGVRLKTLDNGAERGVRIADVDTGSGFHFTVLIDRGMDVGAATWAGWPLQWSSAAGAVHPAYYDPRELGWLRSFAGGLLVGCGLDNVGSPGIDQGEQLGLHGRLSNSPAELIGCGGAWQGDEYKIWIQGRMRHFQLFQANLVLERQISTRLGSDHLCLQDTITNAGFERTPFQLLYHCNLGFPIVSPDSELLLDTVRSEPRDPQAAAGMAAHTRFERPTAGYQEQVFYHYPRSDPDGLARAALVNRSLNRGAFIRFRTAELPYLIQWKMMGQGAYVVGLEPGNCFVQGRAHDRESGVLRFLEPGESVTTYLEIGVLPHTDAVRQWESGT